MMNMGMGTRVRAFMDRLAAEDVNLHGFILSVRGKRRPGRIMPRSGKGRRTGCIP